MPRDAPALVRQLAAGRQVDARDLEERDPVGARVDVVPRRPRRGSGASVVRSTAVLGRDRLRQPQRARVRSSAQRGSACTSRRSPSPTSTSSTRRRSCCSRVSRAEHLAARRQRERDVLEPEARDLLDDVDLARHVARAPGRDDDLGRRRRSKPSRSSSACCSSGGVSMPDHRVGALGAEADRPAARAGRRGRRRRRPSARPASSTRSCGRKVGRRLGEIRVDALLPAVRALGAQAEPLGGAEDRRTARSSPPRAAPSSSPRRSRSPRRP